MRRTTVSRRAGVQPPRPLAASPTSSGRGACLAAKGKFRDCGMDLLGASGCRQVGDCLEQSAHAQKAAEMLRRETMAGVGKNACQNSPTDIIIPKRGATVSWRRVGATGMRLKVSI
jgi:hypothetical protein